MREIVIVISDLYLVPGHAGAVLEAGGSGAPNVGAIGTLPGLEHVARFGGRRSIEGEGGWRPWLARWVGRDDLAGVAPAVIVAAGATVTSAAPADPEHPGHVRSAARAPVEPRGSTAWIATPVHLIAGLTSLHLDRRSILRLSRADLEAFALDFNRTFGDSGLHLLPLPGGDFLMQGPDTLIAATTEPSRALVGDLEASLARGSDSKALKRLGAELEMWLHEHPVNEVRGRRGELSVSTLWLWGGGASLASTAGINGAAQITPVPTQTPTQPLAQTSTPLPPQAPTQPPTPPPAEALTQPNSPAASPSPPSNVAFGSDPYLIGLWHAQGGRTNALPDDKLAGLLADPHAERAVLVAEVTSMLHANPQWTVFEALAELDRLYVSPAIAALRKGAVESVVLIANDAELRIGRRDNLKFWRRALPVMARLQA